MIRHLPNFLTCCNLICGCFGVVFCLENRVTPVAYFVWIAGVFDFLDGFAARWLKAHSPIGKELDSLADVVSFGLLPAMVMYKMIGATTSSEYVPYIGFMIAVFSALRLAIFNIDETQTDSFRGLNTPSNTIFVTSLPLLTGSMAAWIHQTWVLVGITILFSLLMVSRFEFFAFKFRNFRWKDNSIRFTFLLISVLLLAFFHLTAIPFVIILYIAMSLGMGLIAK